MIPIAALVACASQGTVVDHPYVQQPVPGPDDPEFRACFEHPITQRYLQELHRRTIEAWDIEYGTDPHRVVTRVTLTPSGAVADLEVLESPSEEFTRKVTAAIDAAQPFGPVPDEASCLLTTPLRIRFKTFKHH